MDRSQTSQINTLHIMLICEDILPWIIASHDAVYLTLYSTVTQRKRKKKCTLQGHQNVNRMPDESPNHKLLYIEKSLWLPYM